MSNTPLELKGSNFTLSVVHLHDAEPEIIHQALEMKIAQAPDFLKHAPVVVNVAALADASSWPELHKIIIGSGLRVIGVSGCKDPKLKAAIENCGLAILTEGKERVPRPAPAEPVIAPANAAPITKTRLIEQPVRSGQRIYAPNCDLVVTNHVSAGAELIADGNIHVYGMMRGRALAGAGGDREAQIFCTTMMAELVSVAGVYMLSDQIPAEFYGKAVRLRLSSGALSVQPLN
ncbi:septum site-determining protein MinC [Salmonella enterica subsp. enterica serovar Choleraesuis]|nr:septum site-determining protein MinC [Salmonella enterica subsp. enterica serovar Choleraesuis]